MRFQLQGLFLVLFFKITTAQKLTKEQLALKSFYTQLQSAAKTGNKSSFKKLFVYPFKCSPCRELEGSKSSTHYVTVTEAKMNVYLYSPGLFEQIRSYVMRHPFNISEFTKLNDGQYRFVYQLSKASPKRSKRQLNILLKEYDGQFRVASIDTRP